MTKSHIQFTGMLALSGLAACLLAIIAYTLYLLSSHITVDGKVPVLDAGLFTSTLLSFQQTVAAIRSVWESQERSTLAEGLQNSTPNAPIDNTPVPQTAADGAKIAAGAADNEAERLQGQVDAQTNEGKTDV